MQKCHTCTEQLGEEVFISEDEHYYFCDKFCFLQWYAEHYDLPGYYTTIKKHEEWIKKTRKETWW